MKFNKKKKSFPKLYSESQIEQMESYIKNKFGEYEYAMHEFYSPDIHVDIAIILPGESRDYYTLVTIGMGAHKMKVPKELKKYKLERAEIVIYLPKEWDIENNDERWYWPIRWLKILARLPIQQDTWLGFGHTIPNNEPFADNTKLCCALLLSATEVEREILELEDGGIINFYQLFPIYEEEMNFKLQHSAEELIALFDERDICPPIHIQRKNYCVVE